MGHFPSSWSRNREKRVAYNRKLCGKKCSPHRNFSRVGKTVFVLVEGQFGVRGMRCLKIRGQKALSRSQQSIRSRSDGRSHQRPSCPALRQRRGLSSGQGPVRSWQDARWVEANPAEEEGRNLHRYRSGGDKGVAA